CCIMLFFFSSRRRHTRWPRDWSSDVCSSDLAHPAGYWCKKVQGTIGVVPLAEVMDLAPDLLAPVTGRVGGEREVGVGLGGLGGQIGRASCRERVEMSEVAVARIKEGGER